MSLWPRTIKILISNWPWTQKFSQFLKKHAGKTFSWGRTRLPRTIVDFRGRDFVFQVSDHGSIHRPKASHSEVFVQRGRYVYYSILPCSNGPKDAKLYSSPKVRTPLGCVPLASMLRSFNIWLNPRAGKMKRILRSNWLPKQASRVHLARLGFSALVPQEHVLFLAIW